MKRLQYSAVAVLLLVSGARILLPFPKPPLPGDRTTGRLMLDTGVKREDMILYGAGLMPEKLPNSLTLEVRLANAIHLPSEKERWVALQQLGKEFPNSLAIHATLVRYACSSRGGSIYVRRHSETARLIPPPLLTSAGPPIDAIVGGPAEIDGYEQPAALLPSGGPTAPLIEPHPIKPNDVQSLLVSCAVGERLEPDNAYFPAQAAVGYAALHRDEEAEAALHRVIQKKKWDEHLEYELQGMEQRARLLKATNGSTSEILRRTNLLLSHENQINELAMLAIVWAMERERRGDIARGLALRHDVARLGRLMQTKSPWNVSMRLGIVVENNAARRPGGALGLSGEGAIQRTQARYAEYLRKHGAAGEGDAWERDFQYREKQLKNWGVLGDLTFTGVMFETQLRTLTSLVLITTLGLLILVAGLVHALAHFGKRSAPLCISLFLLLLGSLSWITIGTAIDQIGAATLLQQGTCDFGFQEEKPHAESPAADIPLSTSPESFLREYILMGLVPSAVVLWVFLILVLGNRPGKSSRGGLLCATVLPLAAMFGLFYGLDSISFGLRERALQQELHQMRCNENVYLAEKFRQARSAPQP
ncbi:MAG: hypothetical protein QM758_00555 [Armatimonas sp.]